MRPKVLVTGGTGFTGAHLARRLLRTGYRVRLAGRDFSQVQDLLASGAEAFPAALENRSAVLASAEGVDAICHVGALSSNWGKAQEFWAANVLGTQHVLEACQQQRIARLVHISSPSVAFDGAEHRLARESDLPITRHPLSLYAQSKGKAEQLVLASEVNTIVLRPKAIIGEGDRALLPRLLLAARSGRLPIIEDGQNRVDLTYVENVAQAIQLALESSQTGVFTITNAEHPRLWEVVEQVLAECQLPALRRKIPLAVALAVARGAEFVGKLRGKEPLLTRYSAYLLAREQSYDIRAAQELLGYQPEIPLQEGIRRTIAHLRAHA